MTPMMSRLTVAALALLAGCGQDIDLGSSQNVTAGAPQPPMTSQGSAMPGCPFDDPALLKAPDACPDLVPQPSYGPVVAACAVTADGPVRAPENELLTVPACPTGAYFTLKDPFPPETIERAVSAFKGESDILPAFAPGLGTRLPRTVEVFPDRGSFFVRLDPRPSNGRRIDVLFSYTEMYRGTPGYTDNVPISYTVAFRAGTPGIP
jgi:hypothetical protein